MRWNQAIFFSMGCRFVSKPSRYLRLAWSPLQLPYEKYKRKLLHTVPRSVSCETTKKISTDEVGWTNSPSKTLGCHQQPPWCFPSTHWQPPAVCVLHAHRLVAQRHLTAGSPTANIPWTSWPLLEVMVSNWAKTLKGNLKGSNYTQTIKWVICTYVS